MLTHIHVRNLAIVDSVEIELGAGLTALTGETGAGKSILLDALGLVLGDRADSTVVRHGCERAEIAAGFDIAGCRVAQRWLRDNDLDLDGECQLRRIVSREGRSRAYINGQPAPVQMLRELGECLVDLHGQHEHQSLLRTAVQRELLDAFGGNGMALGTVAGLYREWQQARETLDSLITDDSERAARVELLRFQLGELEGLGLDSAGIAAIDAEHARLANASRLLETVHGALARLDSDEGPAAAGLVNRCAQEIAELTAVDGSLEAAARLLNEAGILIEESTATLRDYVDDLELDPQRLQLLEERIGLLHDLARKHRCRPDELPALTVRLREELASIEHAEHDRDRLESRLQELAENYRRAAATLTGKRTRAAAALGRKITAAMQDLGMAGGRFEVAVDSRSNPGFSVTGMDSVVFMVSANRGQPLQALGKVASGGELSRISLAIQVISAGSDTIPTLVFDEVDSGIGGAVAEIVGRELRTLAAARQVICVTHLPQVAACAHQQLQISKQSLKNTTRTQIRVLEQDERVEELARMLGGITITDATRQAALDMMQQPANAPCRRKAPAAVE